MKLTSIVHKTLGSISGSSKEAAKKENWTQAPALNKGLVSDDSANRVNTSTAMPGRRAKVIRGRPAEGQPVSQADSQGVPAYPEPAVLAREKGADFLGASGSPAQGGEVAVGPGEPDWSGPSAPASQLKRLPDAPPLFKLDGRLMAIGHLVDLAQQA